MALFKVRRTVKPNVIPAGLTYGEMAVNLADKKLYVGGTANNAIEIAGGGGSAESTWTSTVPTTASDVAGIPQGTTIDIGSNAISILTQILYPYQSVSFSNFSLGLAANTFDIGQTSAAGNYNATWSASSPTGNWVAGSVNISRAGTSLVSGLDYNSSPTSITHPAYRYTTPTTLSFSLTGQQLQGTNPQTASKDYYWRHKIYWGKSASDPTSTASVSTNGGNRFTSGNTSLGSYTYTFTSSGSALACYVIVPTSLTQYTSWKDENNAVFGPVSGTFTETSTHGVSIGWTWYKVNLPTTSGLSVSAS